MTKSSILQQYGITKEFRIEANFTASNGMEGTHTLMVDPFYFGHFQYCYVITYYGNNSKCIAIKNKLTDINEKIPVELKEAFIRKYPDLITYIQANNY